MNSTGEIVRVAPGVIDAIVAHARADAPNECCGLLVGSSTVIARSVATTNIDPEPLRRYQINPVEHVRLLRALRGTGEDIVGGYHSHPRSPAVPSPTDIGAAYYPDFLYVIVSLADPSVPDVRGYRIVDRQVMAVRLVDGRA